MATVPGVLRPGLTATMSCDGLPNGAEVFAAGAFTLAGLSYRQPVQNLLDNPLALLAEPRRTQLL